MELSKEDALMYLLDEVLADVAAIQTSWIGAPGVPVLRYEEILGNEQAFFEQLVDHCQILVGRERLAGIVRGNMFDAVTGRNRGQEDVNAHLRKGIAGDWRNHFSENVKVEFQRRYGQLLIDTGYERDFNW
jgi:lipopolysaccharide transport system ATP-binding protein